MDVLGSNRSFTLALAVFAALVLVSTPALAGTINYADGSRVTGSGVTATGDYSGDFKVAWDIDLNEDTGVFTYNYTFSDESDGALPQDISHLIIQVSSNFLSSDALTGTDTYDLDTHKSGSNTGNPTMLADLYGLKFQVSSDNPTITIVTKRVPVWGNFYVKDGKSSDGTLNSAYNTGFTSTPPTSLTATATNWILTPDTVTLVPLPASAWLGLGLLGALGLARRLKRRRM